MRIHHEDDRTGMPSKACQNEMVVSRTNYEDRLCSYPPSKPGLTGLDESEYGI